MAMAGGNQVAVDRDIWSAGARPPEARHSESASSASAIDRLGTLYGPYVTEQAPHQAAVVGFA